MIRYLTIRIIIRIKTHSIRSWNWNCRSQCDSLQLLRIGRAPADRLPSALCSFRNRKLSFSSKQNCGHTHTFSQWSLDAAEITAPYRRCRSTARRQAHRHPVQRGAQRGERRLARCCVGYGRIHRCDQRVWLGCTRFVCRQHAGNASRGSRFAIQSEGKAARLHGAFECLREKVLWKPFENAFQESLLEVSWRSPGGLLAVSWQPSGRARIGNWKAISLIKYNIAAECGFSAIRPDTRAIQFSLIHAFANFTIFPDWIRRAKVRCEWERIWLRTAFRHNFSRLFATCTVMDLRRCMRNSSAGHELAWLAMTVECDFSGTAVSQGLSEDCSWSTVNQLFGDSGRWPRCSVWRRRCPISS